MDSITQAALGAAIGEVVLGKKIGNKGAVLGAIIATIPDLDVFLYAFYSPFEMLSIHRGISHSILGSLIGATVVAFILQKLKWTKAIPFKRLWIFAWLAWFTHILLDFCTAYGTQLLLPFSDKRMGLDSINVVDPVYTVPLLIGLILSLFVFKKSQTRSKASQWALIISTAYLLLTLGIKHRVNQHFKAELEALEIKPQALLTMPVGIANINWYGVAKTADSLYMHKYSILHDAQLPFEAFPINAHLLDEIDPYMAEKMKWFAKGFYTAEMHHDTLRIYNLQVDMRGIVYDGDIKAPTMGYFQIAKKDNEFEFSSGTIKSVD